MENYIVNLIGNFGYIGMFIGMILEAIVIIIPSELILATGGILAQKGVFTFIGASIVGVLGSVVCAALIYVMGYFGGRPFIEKYGKYFFMKKEDIEKSDKWFLKYGMIAALIGRNIPIIRTFISLPIGMAKLSFIKFLIYTIVGSIPWTVAFVGAGFYLGENWTFLKVYIDKLKVPIIVLVGICIVIYIYRKINFKKVIFIKTK
ncbi:MAG: DedA family protein [Clostridia bacterium]